MEKNQKVWIWGSAGELTNGIFIGYDGDWLKVDTGDYVVFKKKKQIFDNEEEAKAWQLVKRVKRLLNQGIPMEQVIFPDDKEAYEKAMNMFPEELI